MESSTHWVAQSNGSYSLFSNYNTRSGSSAAYLAGVDGAQDSLRQTLALPAGNQLTLSFWWQVNSEESTSGWDGLSVLLANSQGTPLRSLFTVTDRNASAVWQQTIVDVSQYAGQTIQLQFNARTDNTLATDFFVDDVSVVACDTPSASTSIFLPRVQR